MNTSRDIEKLFDHFGGNAGDYQEIGRENEAKNARTRWPLLATLDFAQPAIPEIVSRRDAQSIARPAPDRQPAQTPSNEPALTPINRGKPPLFARAHRRSIPPVDANPSVDAHRATRFSRLAESAPDSDVQPVAASAAAAIARTNGNAQSQAHTPPALEPLREKTQSERTQNEKLSILGKLFDKPAPAPASNQTNSLDSLFDRLRAAGEPARTWGSRS
jgi:hypothetical protein